MKFNKMRPVIFLATAIGSLPPVLSVPAPQQDSGVGAALSGGLDAVECILDNVVGGNAGGAVGNLVKGQDSPADAPAASASGAVAQSNGAGVAGAVGGLLGGLAG